MEEVAIDQGVGEHYIYDANQLHSRDRGIFGHAASQQAGALGASRFEPAPWLKPQYISLIHASSYSPGGVPMYTVRNVTLAPDYHHGRSVISRLLWGHHTCALNPLHPRAREVMLRWIAANVDLPDLRADTQHGRVLQFAFQRGGSHPTRLRLNIDNAHGHIDFYMDRATRRWEYLGAAN